MHSPTHFFISWAVANVAKLERRDRALVTVAGVIPDLDAAGAIAEILTRTSATPLMWFSEYHHVLCHNLGFALAVVAATFAIARRRLVAAGLALATFHLHLLGDILGARGPDGSQWPIPYLEPFSDAWQLSWGGQWYLQAWPNMAITAAMIALAFYLAWRRGFSFVGLVSTRADARFVEALRKRFGEPRAAGDAGPPASRRPPRPPAAVAAP
jgi:inner membrane protein